MAGHRISGLGRGPRLPRSSGSGIDSGHHDGPLSGSSCVWLSGVRWWWWWWWWWPGIDSKSVFMCISEGNQGKESGSARVDNGPNPMMCFYDRYILLITFSPANRQLSKNRISTDFDVPNQVCCMVIGRFDIEKRKKLPQFCYHSYQLMTGLFFTRYRWLPQGPFDGPLCIGDTSGISERFYFSWREFQNFKCVILPP